jgi:putative hydrolase of the HAD superfamily
MQSGRKMILVFDLDDTLYNEETYVLSGLKAAAKYIQLKYGIRYNEVLKLMIHELKTSGRGKIFDNALIKYNLLNKKRVRELISVYRLHKPEIKLYKDSLNVFKLYKEYPKYVVTDGNTIVQNVKCKALKLEKYIKKIFITYRYGIKYAKPSTYCFHKILETEKAVPENVLYIADNPYKDFINLNKEGFNTVRIMRGMFADIKVKKEQDGMYKIKSLNEITQKFIKNISSNEKYGYH